MAGKNQVLLTFAGDSRSLEAVTDQVGGKLQTFNTQAEASGSRLSAMSDRLNNAGASMRRFGAKTTAFLTLPIVAGLGAAQQASSNLGEAVNATNVVFGEGAAVIDRYAQTSAQSMGLSKRAFREALTPMGAMLQNVGFSQREAADSSVMLAQRAADMASVFNTDVSTALDAINSGLRGEADPLEQFGVGLSAAAVEAKAMEMGLAATADELTDNQKAQARLALLMDQTNDIAGDFANTSGEAANQQRIMAAEAEDAAAQFGNNLKPIMDKLLTVAGGLLEKFNTLSPGMQKLILGGVLAVAAIGPLATILGGLSTIIGVLTGAFAALTLSMGLIILAVIAIIAIIVLLVIHWDTVKAAAGAAWDWIWQKGQQAFNWIRDNWPLILGILTGPIGLAVGLIATHWGTIKSGASNALNTVIGFFTSLPGRILGALGDLGRLLWNAGSSIIGGLLDGITSRFHDVVDFVSDIGGTIASLKGPLPKDKVLLVAEGEAIMMGLRDGIKAGVGDVYSTVAGIAAGIQSIMSTISGNAKSFGIVNPRKWDYLGSPSAGTAYAKVGGRIIPLGHLREDEALRNADLRAAVSRPMGGAASTPTVINVYVQGSVRSDRELVGVISDAARNGAFRGVL